MRSSKRVPFDDTPDNMPNTLDETLACLSRQIGSAFAS
jgi:hypothetical protein